MMLITAYLFVTLTLILFVAWRPFEVLRPSIWFSLLMTVFINGGAAFCKQKFDGYYRDGEYVRLLSILFPLPILYWAAFSQKLSSKARKIYFFCQSEANIEKFETPSYYETTLGVFLVLALAIVCVYLTVVPLMSTGLVTIFLNPARSDEAREHSLKLLDNTFLRYAYSFYINAFAPFIITMITLVRSKRSSALFWKTFLILALAVSTAFTGARMQLGYIVICLGIAHMLKSGFFKGIRMLIATSAATLLIVSTLTVFREGKAGNYNVTSVLTSTLSKIADRTFVIPFKAGLWAIRYVDEYGPIGIKNIRPLALLLGQKPLNFPNMIGRAYQTNFHIESVSANCCFLFDFQASFGLIGGWLIALFCLIILDFGLLPIAQLNNRFSIVCMAVLLLTMISYTSSGYTTCLVTQGTLLVIFLAQILRYPKNKALIHANN